MPELSKNPVPVLVVAAVMRPKLIILPRLVASPMKVTVPPLRLRLAAVVMIVVPDPFKSISGFRYSERAAAQLQLMISELRNMLLWAFRVSEASAPDVLMIGASTMMLPC